MADAVIQMELARVVIRETEDTHHVELREIDPEQGEPRVFPIVIGFNEAVAIERRLMGQMPTRPQTHELLADVIDRLGHTLEAVVISDLRDHTFYAQLRLRNAATDEVVEIDSRPSDALAVGAARDTPIFVAEHVLVDAGQVG